MPVWSFEAIGTRWEIETDETLAGHHRDRVSAIIADFDRDWSRFRGDSVVSLLGRRAGAVGAPADAAAMLNVYRELSAATAGAINPLVGTSLDSLGYDAEYSFRSDGPQAAPTAWEETLRWDGERLELSAPAVIDVGAIGKGRLVDLVSAALEEIPGCVVVDAGGDLAVRGGEIRVGLEHPFDTTKAIGTVAIRDRALCASAVNRRAWGDGLHHVLDARTGIPVRTWAATWAIGPDAMLADAATTALFFDGGPRLVARWGMEWVRMSTDGRVQRSPNCTVQLFTPPGPRR